MVILALNKNIQQYNMTKTTTLKFPILLRLLIGSSSDTIESVYFVSTVLHDDKLQNVIQYEVDLKPLHEEDQIYKPKNEIGHLSVVGIEIHLDRYTIN